MIFPVEALERFERLYPEEPGIVGHDLAGHSLFTLEALAEFAARIEPRHLEYNKGDVPIGLDPDHTPANGLSPEDTIRSIEQCGSWMVLKNVEQDPAYRDLLHGLLAELEPVVAPATGAMLQREGFIFVSSPHSVTPFHFDPEHNILLQLRGSKTMTTFPADDQRIVSDVSHENYQAGGHRNLPWRDEIADAGRPFELRPGEGIYVPVKAPHWVKNGPDVSISFSITWRSEWSVREDHARGFNRLLRRTGLAPAAPGRFPARNLGKAVAYQAASRARQLVKDLRGGE